MSRSLSRYVQQEKRIAASDSGGIWERWRWGLRLLADRSRVTENGNLRSGKIDELIQSATARGYQLSRREIQYRLQAAKTYPTEAQLRTASAQYGDWTSLREAGFPPYEAPADEPAADPRDADERARDHARQLAELAGDQLSLFPDDMFGPLATLAELAKYAEDMAELTARFGQRDTERAAYLAQLIAAAGGDMGVTWEQAERLLRGGDS
jgi:hypothetical protein